MSKRIFYRLAVAVAWSLPLGLASISAGAATDDTVTIGASAPLTGPRANFGRYFKEGVDMAVDEINQAGGVLGKPLKVIFEDDQADNPNAAINAVNRLLEVDKVTAFLGPHFSVAQMATQNIYCGKAVSITGASGVPVTNSGCKTVLRNRADDIVGAKALVTYIHDTLKIKKIGVLSINDDFGKGGADRVIQAMADIGLKPVAQVSHNAEDKDFSAQLATLHDAGAELVIMWTHDTEAALIARQARTLGLTMKFAGSTSLSQPVFVKLAADAGDGAISITDFITANPEPRVQAFVKEYQARYKAKPELYAATYYDAAHLMAKAIDLAGSLDPQDVRAAFGKVKYDGVLADYHCVANGDCNHQVYIVEVQHGEIIIKGLVKL